MVKLDILNLLEQKGKTKYWLYKQMGGMSYQNFNKMANGKTKGIRFETIEILCQVLDCTPNDLFVMDLEQPEGK
ncbi:helix-turn-helix domain-containing protein [Oscillibacter sp.]|uniref:helix-turn-helix domain-containing protein n=1 Tax=Oscillibacter sp. TaxID=1945593 RepID=UPI001B4BC0A5|nr:helix-turn-helix domain-containing protein [Oscillibacter sp.]MBP3509657.1 helix-turn-helix domain-containing protein [Oscillibacter sp.]